MNVKQITIFLEDKPGTLHAALKTLADENIHLRAFTAADMGGMTLLRLIVDNIIYTTSLLKSAGYNAAFTDVFVAEVSDPENGLIKLLDLLSDSGINIQHAYPITSKNKRWIGREIYMVFEVNNNARAMEILHEEGITLLTQEEIAEL